MRAATTSKKRLGKVAALSFPLLFSSLVFLVSSFAACAGAPCQRNSDCPSRYVCGPYAVCELESVPDYPDPPDASDDSVPPLSDGALDDSDRADPPDAGSQPDAI